MVSTRRRHRSRQVVLLGLLVGLLAPPAAMTANPSASARAASPGRAAQVEGRTLHVASDGADEGDGSAENPWRTIQRAAAEVAPGDTVPIDPGAYEGGITVDNSGTEDRPITFRANGDGVVIEGSGEERDAFFFEEADYVVVEGLTIQHATRAGLRVSLSSHVTIRDSVFADNGTWGIFTDFSDELLIENNEAFGSGEEHGIYVSNSGDRPVLRGNVVHDNVASGIQLNADVSMGDDGIISGALIEGNVIYDNGEAGGAAINLDGVEDAMIRNNLLYDNRATGVALFQGNGAVCSRNNRVLNNTIVMPADSRWAVLISPSADCAGNALFNNVILSANPDRGSVSIPVADLPGFESDYNLVVDRFSADDESSIIALADWQALGFDLHSRTATPDELFVDPAAGDFRPADGSPAIDAGTALDDEVSQDLAGNPRPAGAAYDVGAYEVGADVILAPTIEVSVVRATAVPTPTRDDEVVTPAGDDATVRVEVDEVDDSGVAGLAFLTPNDGQTDVTILLEGAGPNVVIFVHRGSCAGSDLDPAFLLAGPDETGQSESTLDITLEDLIDGGYVIAIHVGAQALETIVACGDIATDGAAFGTAVAEMAQRSTSPPAAASI